MEHFLCPDGTQVIDIPYVGTKIYDGGDFLSFPSRQNWTQDDLIGLNSFGGRSKQEVEAFFQTWLYFGCLISVLSPAGVPVETEDFIRVESESGKEYITTKSLPGFILDWMKREGLREDARTILAPKYDPKSANRIERSGRGNNVKAIMACVHKFVNMYCNSQSHQLAHQLCSMPAFWPMSDEISLSIMAIGTALSYVATEIYEYPRMERLRWGSSSLLDGRLKKAGWCPRDTPVFSRATDGGVDSDYYFGSTAYPRRIDHSSCTKLVCSAKTVDTYAYTTKHRPDCEQVGCGFIPPPGSALEILKDGGIPIMTWSEADGKLLCSRYDKDSMTRYVAISHVWADGLGNEIENSLPRCQLAHLQYLVDDLYSKRQVSFARRRHPGYHTQEKRDVTYSWLDGDTWDTALPATEISSNTRIGFWVDTLCVPVQEEHKEYRKVAIRQMQKIYTSAHRVLVLDSWIQQVPLRADVLTKYVSLYLSSWPSRLWTLQEGLFARSLFFQFKDGAQTTEHLTPEFEDLKNESVVKFYSSVGTGCWEQFYVLYEVYNMLSEIPDAVIDPSLALHPLLVTIGKRSSTKAADQAICLATVLRIDPGYILSGPDETRMERCYEMAKKFDARIVFNQFPRLKTNGFRWAPKTLLGLSYDIYPGHRKFKHKAIVAEGGGLLVEHPGVEFSLDWTGNHRGTQVYFIHLSDLHPPVQYKIRLQPDEEGNFPIWESGGQYVLISAEALDGKNAVIQEAILAKKGGEIDNNGRIGVTHLTTATAEMRKEAGISDRPAPDVEEMRNSNGDEMEFVRVFPLRGWCYPSDQKWRII